jgi:hypothetical protein
MSGAKRRLAEIGLKMAGISNAVTNPVAFPEYTDLGWSLEKACEWLAIYKKDVTVKPEELPQVLDQAIAICGAVPR